MLTFLHKRKLPVSWPMKGRDGLRLTRIAAPEGVRYAVLFTGAPGKKVRMNTSNSGSYGELVGRIHVCLDGAPDDDRRFHLDLSHLVDEPLRHMEPFLGHRRKDFDYIKGVGHELKQKIDALLPKTRPEYGNCHGDHHGGNVHIDKDGILTLYDFDCYGYGWRAYDIAVFLWSQTSWEDWSAKAKSRRTKRWNAFLGGYANARALSAAELEATRVFVPLRHIWILGLHTHGAETWGRGWIDDGYFDFHVRFIKRWIEYYRLL